MVNWQQVMGENLVYIALPLILLIVILLIIISKMF